MNQCPNCGCRKELQKRGRKLGVVAQHLSKRNDEIIEQRKTMTLDAIAEIHGITHERVRQILKRNGIAGRISLPSRETIPTAEELEIIAKNYDAKAAKIIGRSCAWIRKNRERFGMPEVDYPGNSKFDYAAIAKMYADGEKTEAIVKKTGCYAPTITRACRVNGVKMRGGGRANRKPIDETWMKKLYCEYGMSAEEVGKEFGVIYTTILNRLRRMGVTIRHQGRAR